MSKFTWIPVIKEICNWIIDYENRQLELIEILKKIGINNGLVDKLNNGKKTQLKVIDPFTFIALILKHGDQKRSELLKNLIAEAGLDVAPPTDFTGVPNVIPTSAWFFAYTGQREENTISNLWKLFHQAVLGKIEPKLFEDVQKIKGIGFAKLTQGLFWIAPEFFFPVDKQTRQWMQRLNIEVPSSNLESYQHLLELLKTSQKETFYELSQQAWFENQHLETKQSDQKLDENQSRSFLSPDYEIGLNTILYGPPGTGKTFNSIVLAVKIADPEKYEELYNELDWDELNEVCRGYYDELVEEGRIVFTTFHQSFSYEDFIEGIRANTEDGKISYQIEEGIFKKISQDAEKSVIGFEEIGVSENPTIWKISIGRTYEEEMRNRYISNGEARIGWNETGDLSIPLDERDKEQQEYWNELSSANHSALENFAYTVKKGDIFLCLKGAETVQAVGIVISDYRYDDSSASENDDYAHVRDVKWILKDIELNILPVNDGKQLVQQTLYPLYRISWDGLINELHRQSIKLPKAFQKKVDNSGKNNYVLIIDEINRGNISRIFGELITLLEPSKRKDAEETLSVILPYSRQPFSVPSNLYIIGTMNTADKSLTHIDLALRRRFDFIELNPDCELLEDITVFDISINEVLEVMNQRIEILLDRDHRIGHAYLYPLIDLEDEDEKEAVLANIFEKKIIPLLQEYFFADWERIGWVLNDTIKPDEARFIQLGKVGKSLVTLFPKDISPELIDRRYKINMDSFTNPLAYQLILQNQSGQVE